ncbi:MAG: radical SAM protein, partial [bacterium]|nr:radical SAM protein [bacterium]
DFDRLPLPNRTLIDYQKYHRYIGIAMARHTVSLQATRGCPFKCAFCHKIWPKKHIFRKAENIFQEVLQCHSAGVRRFVFIDDVFNLDRKNSARFFEKIIHELPGVQLFFPNGLRGDILDKELIDLMVRAGTVNIDLALESASPRIQKLINKNLNLEKFKENVQYITRNHPRILLEMELIVGFPTETGEE